MLRPDRRDKVHDAGKDFVLVAINAYARAAFTDIHPDERFPSPRPQTNGEAERFIQSRYRPRCTHLQTQIRWIHPLDAPQWGSLATGACALVATA
ncbi:hypothetical protein CAL11_04270 [Bordetella genomosp. 6]|nr:hypothetical protein CAL11_04270 [Bordetella genomosp. 6]